MNKMVDKFLDVMGFLDKEEEFEEEELYPEIQSTDNRKRKLVAIPNHNNRDRDNVKVILSEPKEFDDAQIIADNLKKQKAVIINMENSDYELAKRVIDFVGGTAYAIGGSMQKIGQSIILAVPPNIDISGEFNADYITDQEEVFSWVAKFGKKGDL